MEGADGPEWPCVRLPVEIAQRESGDQARRKELVDIVGIGVFDWKTGEKEAVSWGAVVAKLNTGRGTGLPVTLDDENGCSMLDSASRVYGMTRVEAHKKQERWWPVIPRGYNDSFEKVHGQEARCDTSSPR